MSTLIEPNTMILPILIHQSVDFINVEMEKEQVEMNEKANAKCKQPCFKCNECEDTGGTKVSLMKHKNTKHALKPIEQPQVSVPKCSLCDDEFKTFKEYEAHKQEHIDKIEEIDVTSLTNGLEMFECNLCSFESGHEDSIKEHMIDHVNFPNISKSIENKQGTENEDVPQPKLNSKVKAISDREKKRNDKKEALKSGNLLDLYDDEGNPLYDTTDSEESDSE